MLEKKHKTKLLISAIFVVVAFLLAVLSTFAWFSIPNPQSKISSLYTSDEPQLHTYTSLDGQIWEQFSSFNFSGLMCGHGYRFYIKLENRSLITLPINLRIDSPCIDNEVPAIVQNAGIYEYYYLGSQIKICSVLAFNNAGVAISLENKTATLPLFLVTTALQGNGQVSFVSDRISNIPCLNLVTDLAVSANETIVFRVDFEFASNGSDQNAYQNFGLNSLCRCFRKLSVVIKSGA